MRALFNMNQMGGFDCPSCAWPDPDDERSALGEYCENGAKALAEEATTKTVTPEFLSTTLYTILPNWMTIRLVKWEDLQIQCIYQKVVHITNRSVGTMLSKIAEHLNALESPDEAAFILREEQATRLPLYISYLLKSLG